MELELVMSRRTASTGVSAPITRRKPRGGSTAIPQPPEKAALARLNHHRDEIRKAARKLYGRKCRIRIEIEFDPDETSPDAELIALGKQFEAAFAVAKSMKKPNDDRWEEASRIAGDIIDHTAHTTDGLKIKAYVAGWAAKDQENPNGGPLDAARLLRSLISDIEWDTSHQAKLMQVWPTLVELLQEDMEPEE